MKLIEAFELAYIHCPSQTTKCLILVNSCILSFQYWDKGNLKLFEDLSVYANCTLELLMFENKRVVKLLYHNCYLTLERMKIIYTTLGILQRWVYDKDTNYGIPLRLLS